MSKNFHDSYENEEEEDKKQSPTTLGAIISLILLALAAFLWFKAVPEYVNIFYSQPEKEFELEEVKIPGDGTIPGRQEEEAAFVFFDVKNGCSLLTQAPDNSTSLIDGGEGVNPRNDKIPAYDLAKNLYIPFFKLIGINRLNYMISTTPFSHYMGAQVDLARYNNLTIKDVLLPPYKNKFPPFQILKSEAGAKTKVKNMEEKQSLVLGPGLKGKVLYAPKNKNSRAEASNVLLLQYGNVRLLIMSHLPREQEKKLVQRWGDSLKTDLILVGRHGGNSATSPLLLKYAQPTFAVISRAENSPLTEGSEKVIGRLKENGIKSRYIFRTDRDSHIVFYTDGRKVRFKRNAFPFL
ncbi:MAG: ComEC/Rec2 family competence protein [bacterium]